MNDKGTIAQQEAEKNKKNENDPENPLSDVGDIVMSDTVSLGFFEVIGGLFE